jgi:GAF domain-containing protein
MPREESVVRSLVRLAGMLDGDCGVADLLAVLVDRCVHMLGATAAAVTFVAPEGDLRSMAATDEAMHRLSLLEVHCRRGPSVDAARTGVRFVNQELCDETGSWSHFSRAAAGAGFRSVTTFPMGTPDHLIGALTILNDVNATMGDAEVSVAGALSDMATRSIVRHRAQAERELSNGRLERALESRILVEQAKGVIVARRRISLGDADSLMRNYAETRGLAILDVAHGVIHGTVDPPVHPAPAGPGKPWLGSTLLPGGMGE